MKTVRRFEYKYLISYADYFKLKPLIEATMLHDKHGPKESYDIHSIYFDDLVFTGAADKAFGNQFHKKFRIRYYEDKSKCKLELKSKVADESTKYSTNISEELYEAIINQDIDVLERHFDDPLIRRFTLDLFRFHLTPTCNIVYKREAYMDSTDNLRITFDHSLEASRFEPEFTSYNTKLLPSSQLILEVKYEFFIPKHIKQILQQVSLDQLSVSKYFLGYIQITP